MSTYQEVAENLIRLYAHYVEVCTANEESYDDFSDDLVIAVEALLIRADQEKRKSMEREVISQLQSYSGIPNPAIAELIAQEDALTNHILKGEF